MFTARASVHGSVQNVFSSSLVSSELKPNFEKDLKQKKKLTWFQIVVWGYVDFELGKMEKFSMYWGVG